MAKPRLHVTDWRAKEHYRGIGHLVDVDVTWDLSKKIETYDGFIVHDDSPRLERSFVPRARSLGKPVILYRVRTMSKTLLETPGVYVAETPDDLPGVVEDVFGDS